MTNDFIRVNSNDPCQACGRTTGCTYIISNGWRRDICLRNDSSNRVASDGRFIHKTRSEGLETPAIAILRPLPAPIKRRDAVYNKMLMQLTLEDRDFNHLKSRGLEDKYIAKLVLECRYKSTADVAQTLESTGYILDRVPGFYKEEGIWRANTREGFFIPVRDSLGRIQALQMRTYSERYKYIWFSSFFKTLPDGKRQVYSGGASSGAPIHWVQGKGKTVWCVEGILKSDVVGLFTGLPILGKAGTGWRIFMPCLNEDHAGCVEQTIDGDDKIATCACECHVWLYNDAPCEEIYLRSE